MIIKMLLKIGGNSISPMFKYNFLFLLFSSICILSEAQALQLPSRDPAFPEGTQIIKFISDQSLENRESIILYEVLRGNIPGFYRKMVPVKDSAFIEGKYRHISYYVIADYLALGSDTNYFLCPMTPILAQIIADSLNCILPTRKMVNQIWKASSVKMKPQTISPGSEMTTVPIFVKHNTMVKSQRQLYLQKYPSGNLVSGNKKDVIISNSIYNNSPAGKVVIYGWHYQSGEPIQAIYAGHSESYVDYSHGIRLVQKEVSLDGERMSITDILKSAHLNILLSDEGIISSSFYPDTASTVKSFDHSIQKK